MYALDTNTLSNLFRGNNDVLNNKFGSVAPQLIFLPVIVAEEQIKGRLAFIASDRLRQNAELLPQAYRYFQSDLDAFTRFTILSYTERAHQIFQGFPPVVKRIGSRDCRIAAIVLENDFTLITDNLQHFGVVPGLKVENWAING